jgi:hypothetical protein
MGTVRRTDLGQSARAECRRPVIECGWSYFENELDLRSSAGAARRLAMDHAAATGHEVDLVVATTETWRVKP